MESYLDLTIIDEEGAETTLGSLCVGVSLCVFLRHWGCAECSLLLHRLEPRLSELIALGARIVFIGLGSAQGIASFRAKHRFTREDICIVTDPTLSLHNALGLERGLMKVQGPKALFNRAKLGLQGYKNQSEDGDLLQQGGAVLLDAGREEIWRHKNTYFGDVLDPNELVEAVLQERARSSLSSKVSSGSQ